MNLNEKPDHLTEEEWAALLDDEGGQSPLDDPIIDDESAAAKADEEAARAETEEAEAAAKKAADDAAKIEAEAVRQAEEVEKNKAKADADAKMAEISTKLEKLDADFDSGELTAAEYRAQVTELNDEVADIQSSATKQAREQEIAQAAETARREALNDAAYERFLEEANNFVKDTPYQKSQLAFSALDAAVKEVAKLPESAKMTSRQILDAAHERVMQDPVLAVAFQEKNPAAKSDEPPAKAVPPKTLAKMPAATATDTSDDRFSALDRLADNDTMAYEAAVAKMSESERDAYLSRG